MAGEPAAMSAAVGRMNEQEVEAASFAEKEVLELLQASFKVLSAPRAGACAQGSGRR